MFGDTVTANMAGQARHKTRRAIREHQYPSKNDIRK
jgi:hypothetical protein